MDPLKWAKAFKFRRTLTKSRNRYEILKNRPNWYFKIGSTIVLLTFQGGKCSVRMLGFCSFLSLSSAPISSFPLLPGLFRSYPLLSYLILSYMFLSSFDFWALNFSQFFYIKFLFDSKYMQTQTIKVNWINIFYHARLSSFDLRYGPYFLSLTTTLLGIKITKHFWH